MTSISIGAIIWLAVRPLIRLLICLLSGFVLTKCSLFPPGASKCIGQMIINICMPCLLFSKIVPAFNSENVRFIGPLVLLILVYEAIGIATAWIIKQFCWVPHRFRYGFLAAGAWSNIGDIPTAVLLSLTSTPPFKSTDSDLAIAYLSVLIVVFNTTLFTCGGYKVVAMDYTGPDIDIEADKQFMRHKREKMFRTLRHYASISFLPRRVRTRPSDPEQPLDTNINNTGPVLDQGNEKPTLVLDTDAEVTEIPNVDPPSPTVIDPASPRLDLFYDKPIGEKDAAPLPPVSPPFPSPTTFKTQLIKALQSILSPPSLAVLISIPISLILPLKSLFLVPKQSIHFSMPNLPDGQPPLAVILDTAQFIGVAAVPLGLICLGGALARLRLPKPTPAPTPTPTPTSYPLAFTRTNLPLAAIALLSLSKLVFLPVFGVLIVRSFIAHGIIPKDDKVLSLVCMFCACLPTSTTQVYLTQIYSGTGNTEWLAAFLVPQYILMVPMMTVYIGLILKILFG